MNQALLSSKTGEWETPKEFFDRLNWKYHFTLDAAATPENAKCERYFTPESDGLSKSWEWEIVWCNPPYGRDIGKWVKKGYEESKYAVVVMLLPARTDTDNMVKSLKDCMTRLGFWLDDAQVCMETVRKSYAAEPGVKIVVSKWGAR